MTRREIAEEVRRMNRAARAVEEAPLPAAQRVAGFIVDRWRGAGVKGWTKDVEGRPAPAPAHLQHVAVKARSTSPSGKALFLCSGCEMKPSPVPPRGDCPGEALYFAESVIAVLLLQGVVYAPRGADMLPLPPEVREAEEPA